MGDVHSGSNSWTRSSVSALGASKHGGSESSPAAGAGAGAAGAGVAPRAAGVVTAPRNQRQEQQQPRWTMKDPPRSYPSVDVGPRGGGGGGGGGGTRAPPLRVGGAGTEAEGLEPHQHQPPNAVALCEWLAVEVRRLVAIEQRRGVDGGGSNGSGLPGAARPGREATTTATTKEVGGSCRHGRGRRRRRREDSEDDDAEDDESLEGTDVVELRRRKRRKVGDDGRHAGLADGEDTVEELENVIESLSANNERLRRDLHKERNDKASLESELARVRDENRELRRKVQSRKESSNSRREKSKLDQDWKRAARAEREMPRTNGYDTLSDELDSVHEESDESNREERKPSPRSSIGTVPQRRRSPDSISPSVARPADGAARAGGGGGGRGSTSGVDHRAIAHRVIAKGYLEKPVTEQMEAVMRKGVKAFLAFQVGKSHPKYAPGERVYYVCQACSFCRDNPRLASYFSFDAKQYPNHPLHCAGFAAYDAHLPKQPKVDFRRHLKLKRNTPGIIVADPPAVAIVRRRTNSKRKC